MREVRALLLLVGECNAHSFACTLDTKQALLLLRFNVRALRRRNVHMDSCSHMEWSLVYIYSRAMAHTQQKEINQRTPLLHYYYSYYYGQHVLVCDSWLYNLRPFIDKRVRCMMMALILYKHEELQARENCTKVNVRENRFVKISFLCVVCDICRFNKFDKSTDRAYSTINHHRLGPILVCMVAVMIMIHRSLASPLC